MLHDDILIRSESYVPLPMIRGILVTSGLLVFTMALITPSLRRPDGWLVPVAWTLAVVGLSLAVIGAAWRSRWQRCAILLALAMSGQACSLQLLDVGPSIKLQHYFSWTDLLTSIRGVFLFGLLGQTMIIMWVVHSDWRSIRDGISRLWSARLIILLGFMAFAGVTFSRDPIRYLGESTLAGWVVIVNLVNIALAAAAVPSDTLTRWVDWLKQHVGIHAKENTIPSRFDRLFPWITAGWVVLVASALNRFAFDGIPHIPDSVAYLFQAKYFAFGHLFLPSPPDSVAFALPHTINDAGKWYGIFPPGWPAVLALGVRLGVAWLINPLLAGLTVLLAHALVARLYTRQMAHVIVSFLAVSPMFLFMSASFMAHPLSVVCSLTAFLGVQQARDSGRAAWGVLAGFGLGALILTRPFEGVLVGIVTGLWALGVGGKRIAFSPLILFAITSLALGGLLFPYNRALTGDAIYDPIAKSFDEKYYPGSNRLGFGRDIGNVGWTGLDPLPGHGPIDAIVNANQNVYMMNFDLFGWAFGSLWFAALLLFLGLLTKTDRLLVAVVLVIICGLSLYWFSGGPDLGARYWYQVLIPVVVLTVRGVQALQGRIDALGFAATMGHRLWAFIAVASLVAFINVVPWRTLDKYHHYRGMRPDIRQLNEEYRFGHSLVFIQGEDIHSRFSDYSSAAIFNPPTLDEQGPIYARDLGPTHTSVLRRHFADRPVWVVAAPSITGSGMQVVAGPLPPTLARY